MLKLLRSLAASFAAIALLAGCATAAPGQPRFDEAAAAYDRGDYAKAFVIWKELADDGDIAAMRNVGQLYRRGLGVERDPVMAFRYYGRAAELGLATAMANVGVMYVTGEGVEANPAD